MQKSFIDSIAELRTFVNRKEVPANHVGFLLGKPRTAHMFGAVRVQPFDPRFSTILVNMKPQNFNIIRFIVFTCTENPVGLAEMEAKFGKFEAKYDADKNVTVLQCRNFEESELLETITAVIEGHQMENAEGGLLLHQGGRTVLVPTSEILLPEFTFTFKEWERPEDKSGKNPIFAR